MTENRKGRGVLHNSWCAHILQALEDLGGEATIGEIFENLERSDNPVTKRRIREKKYWKGTVSQMLRGNADGKGHDVFQRIARGFYGLKKRVSPIQREVRDKIKITLRMLQAVEGLVPESVELESHFEEGRESIDVKFVCKVKKG